MVLAYALRRNIQAWRTTRLPYVVTHMVDNAHDEVLNQLRINLINRADDPVKWCITGLYYSPIRCSGWNTPICAWLPLGAVPSYYERGVILRWNVWRVASRRLLLISPGLGIIFWLGRPIA